MRHIRIAVFITFFCLVTGTNATAAPLSTAEIDTRLNTATQLLDSQKTTADTWEYGWGMFDGATLLVSIGQAENDNDHRSRNADIVQASESLIGLADVMLRPLPAFNADSVCPEYMETEEEKRECLFAKEHLLALSAERAQDPYTLLPHLGNAGFNLLAGVIIWEVGNKNTALVTAISGEMIGEAQIWTTPSQPVADYNQYRIRFSPLLADTGHPQNPAAGLALSFRF